MLRSWTRTSLQVVLLLCLVLYSSVSYSRTGESILDPVTSKVLEVLECESNFRPNIWGDLDYLYPAYGIAQFQGRTFKWLAKKSGRKDLQWKNPKDQIWLLTWSIKNGYGYLWSCYRKLQ